MSSKSRSPKSATETEKTASSPSPEPTPPETEETAEQRELEIAHQETEAILEKTPPRLRVIKARQEKARHEAKRLNQVKGARNTVRV